MGNYGNKVIFSSSSSLAQTSTPVSLINAVSAFQQRHRVLHLLGIEIWTRYRAWIGRIIGNSGGRVEYCYLLQEDKSVVPSSASGIDGISQPAMSCCRSKDYHVVVSWKFILFIICFCSEVLFYPFLVCTWVFLFGNVFLLIRYTSEYADFSPSELDLRQF